MMAQDRCVTLCRGGVVLTLLLVARFTWASAQPSEMAIKATIAAAENSICLVDGELGRLTIKLRVTLQNMKAVPVILRRHLGLVDLHRHTASLEGVLASKEWTHVGWVTSGRHTFGSLPERHFTYLHSSGVRWARRGRRRSIATPVGGGGASASCTTDRSDRLHSKCVSISAPIPACDDTNDAIRSRDVLDRTPWSVGTPAFSRR